MAGNIIDLEQRRKMLREAMEKEKHSEDNSLLVPCPKCGDTLFWIARTPNAQSDDPYAVICQHCIEPVGYSYEFPPDDEDETE